MLKKKIIILTSLAIVNFSFLPYANAEEKEKGANIVLEKQSNQVKVTSSGIFIGDKFYTPSQFIDYLDENGIELAEKNQTNSFALAPAIYFVPGIGEVALMATGVIVVGGITIAAGNWMYDTITKYFNDPENAIATTYGIPKKLLDSSGKVKLGDFKDKYGNTPRNTNSGTFKNGDWNITKDTGGHGGSKWKLDKNGKRKASLDGTGKVLRK